MVLEAFPSIEVIECYSPSAFKRPDSLWIIAYRVRGCLPFRALSHLCPGIAVLELSGIGVLFNTRPYAAAIWNGSISSVHFDSISVLP